MIKVNVLFLGPARDFARRDAIEVRLNGENPTLSDILRAIRDTCPELGGLPSTWRWAVNQAFASDDAPIRDGDEIAIIPPVSGG